MSQSRPNHVVLIGDSTLDNYHWVLNDKTATVTEQLKQSLSEQDIVHNLAVDGFTTKDVLQGAYRDKVFSSASDDQHTHEWFAPLDELEKIAAAHQPTHIYISVGGNDLRESLAQLIFSDPDDRLEKLDTIIDRIQRNYQKIIDSIQTICPDAKLVMMLQYTPDVTADDYCIYFLMEKMVTHTKINQDGKYDVSRLLTMLDFAIYRLLGRTISTQDAAVDKLHEIMSLAYRPLIDYARKKTNSHS